MKPCLVSHVAIVEIIPIRIIKKGEIQHWQDRNNQCCNKEQGKTVPLCSPSLCSFLSARMLSSSSIHVLWLFFDAEPSNLRFQYTLPLRCQQVSSGKQRTKEKARHLCHASYSFTNHRFPDLRRCFLCLELLFEAQVQDAVLRALLCAVTAVHALLRINVCQVVSHMHRIMLAGPLAHPAADAGSLADCHRGPCIVLVGTLDDHELLCRL